MSLFPLLAGSYLSSWRWDGVQILEHIPQCNLLTTALMEWNALHTILAPGSGFCHNALLSIKETLQLPLSTRAVPAGDDPPLYKCGSKTGPGCLQGESELLTELGEVISRINRHIRPLLYTWHIFHNM